MSFEPRVFPVYPPRFEGSTLLGCSCKKGAKCPVPGKHPVLKGWQKLEESAPIPEGYNYGIITGIDGLFVLDIDTDSLEEAQQVLGELLDNTKSMLLSAEGPQDKKHAFNSGDAETKSMLLSVVDAAPHSAAPHSAAPHSAAPHSAAPYLDFPPSTYIVATPRGGMHIYLYSPAGMIIPPSVKRLHPKVDVRGRGGMVIGPGSVHRNGGTYTVLIDAPIASAPIWLCERLTATRPAAPLASPLPSVTLTPELEEKIIEELLSLPLCVRGNGTAELRMLDTAARLVRKHAIPPADSTRLILAYYNDRHSEADQWSEYEIAHKVNDALHYTPEVSDWYTAGKRLPEPPPRPVVVESTEPRKQHVEGHQYTFTVGAECNPGVEKTLQGDIGTFIALLCQSEEWAGVWQTDTITGRIHAVDPPMKLDAEGKGGLSDTDVLAVREYFQVRNSRICGKDMAWDVIQLAASKVRYNPIQEYLYALPPGNPDGLRGEAATIFGDLREVADWMYQMWLRSAIARILRPGVQADSMLCLLSETQGAHKSTFGRILFGDDYFEDDMPPVNTKDASQTLAGKWCVEFAEVESALRKDPAGMKSFLSRRVDYYRPAYARAFITRPRMCVFIGTSNTIELLQDHTGNRRYWPINVGKKLDSEYLRQSRNRQLADALAGVLLAFEDIDAGVSDDLVRYRWWATADEELQLEATRAAYMPTDQWSSHIEVMLETLAAKGTKEFTLEEILNGLVTKFGWDLSKIGQKEQHRVWKTLKSMGCGQKKTESKRLWTMPLNIIVRALKAKNRATSLGDGGPLKDPPAGSN